MQLCHIMAFFGDLPREKYSVTSTLSVCSLRFSLIYFLTICLFYTFVARACLTPHKEEKEGAEREA